jgi:hypothetical protein
VGLHEGTEKILAVAANSNFTPIWRSNNSNKRVRNRALYLHDFLERKAKVQNPL